MRKREVKEQEQFGLEIVSHCSSPESVSGRAVLSRRCCVGDRIYFQTPGMRGMFSPLGYQLNVSPLLLLLVDLFVCIRKKVPTSKQIIKLNFRKK